MPKKYFIITYGCQMNEADSERIATSLERKSYKPALKENEADLIVINMCSIRQSAVDRIYGKIRNLAKLKKDNPRLKIVLTGCILKKDRRKFKEILVEEDLSSSIRISLNFLLSFFKMQPVRTIFSFGLFFFSLAKFLIFP